MATITIAEQEQQFRTWLRTQYHDNGIRRYNDNAIMAYSYALRTIMDAFGSDISRNLFRFQDLGILNEALKELKEDRRYIEAMQKDTNKTFQTAIELYKYYLEYGANSQAPDISSSFYISSDVTKQVGYQSRPMSPEQTEKVREAMTDYEYHEVPMVPVQKIFYGAPGTGKSYHITKMMEEKYPDEESREKHSARLIFHPVYTYQDLIGSIKPMVSQDRPLDYIFVAGPLTQLLKDAFLNPHECFYLIIEEINRGNSPAIFGDLFQLLDRNSDGRSRYTIANHDMASFFARDPALKKLFRSEMIWFPPNFNIVATMNTADENIFVLDNAFKRRFALEYVRINFDVVPPQWSQSYATFAGSKPLLSMFQGSALEDYANQLYYEGKLSRDWPTFARLVNHLIDVENKKAIDAMDDDARRKMSRIPENKKLGPFFVSEGDLCQRDTFVNKVIFYLKQDVFPDHHHYLTDSFEEISIRYLEDEADLFEILV